MIRRKLSRKEIILAGLGLFLAVSVVTLYIWQQAEAVRLGLRIGRLEKQCQTLREDVNKLELKKSSLLSLDRVDRIARDELGLVDPKDDQVIYEGGKRTP